MSQKFDISKELLLKLYVEDKLSTYQISEKFNCCQATIWKKLKEFNLKARLSGAKRVNLTKEQLSDLYLTRKLSTWKIEKELKISRGTIHRKLREFGLTVRNLADSHIIYPRKDFSGNLIEKAYLIGFRIGDLGVRKIYPNSKTITVASGSTAKEQIDLIEELFKEYGAVRIKKTKNNKINIWVALNESFDFLLIKKVPKWIEEDKKTFFSFLGGFTDAEGTISKNNKLDYYSLGNYDNNLLFLICKHLNKYGIKCNSPTSDNRKGKSNSQGYKYSSNYWSIRIFRKKDLEKLLIELKPYIKHRNKIKALNIAIDSIKLRNKLHPIHNER